MRAAVIAEDRTLEVAQVDDPAPGPGELVLAVKGCGICGSDLKVVNHLPIGYTMGHEFAGEVVAVGSDPVGKWKAGDAVCALPLVGCGNCQYCWDTLPVHCPHMEMIGTGVRPGAYAEYVAVSSAQTFRLPEGCGYDVGALVEPLAIGLHAVDTADIAAGDNVLIVGAGPVGLAVALWCHHVGARSVVVSDPVAVRRESAGQFGATGIIDPEAEELSPAFERLAGAPPDVVVEAVGKPGIIQSCIEAAAHRGRAAVVGICSGPDPIIPVFASLKELTMTFPVYYRHQDYAHTLAMIDQGRIDPAPFITHTVDLDGLPEAFEAIKSPTDQCKVLIRP
ncbi:MAG: alcohol dehydrogenase catalytic domain-containing protein [bacterium]|nr:alcohol dehydrogenase catalytic domain-containing protein [bacterium]